MSKLTQIKNLRPEDTFQVNTNVLQKSAAVRDITYKSLLELLSEELGGGGGGLTESDLINTTRTFNKAQAAAITALTSSGSAVSINLQDANMWSLTLTEDTTLLNPSADLPTTGIIIGNQDGTGGRTLSFGGNWTVLGDPLPTAPGSEFHISFYSNGAGRLVAVICDETL
jgi:hypothetical protein